MFKIYIYIYIILILGEIAINKAETSGFIHDFRFAKETSTGKTIYIDVFKSTRNDEIIKTKEPNKLKLLEWTSIGDPNLVLHIDLCPFSFKSNGFEIQIDMLGKEDQNLIKEEINEKYEIEVKNKQIKAMILDQIECTIEFETEREWLRLIGKGIQYNKIPVQIWFNYSKESKGRNLFQK